MKTNPAHNNHFTLLEKGSLLTNTLISIAYCGYSTKEEIKKKVLIEMSERGKSLISEGTLCRLIDSCLQWDKISDQFDMPKGSWQKFRAFVKQCGILLGDFDKVIKPTSLLYVYLFFYYLAAENNVPNHLLAHMYAAVLDEAECHFYEESKSMLCLMHVMLYGESLVGCEIISDCSVMKSGYLTYLNRRQGSNLDKVIALLATPFHVNTHLPMSTCTTNVTPEEWLSYFFEVKPEAAPMIRVVLEALLDKFFEGGTPEQALVSAPN